jgi:hypothetical protein
VIEPLAPQAVPLIAWRLRSVGDKESRVMMEGLHTCANCRSMKAEAGSPSRSSAPHKMG